MGKILRLYAGAMVVLATFAFVVLLMRPGWRLVGILGLAGVSALVVVWWIIAVRNNRPEPSDERDDGLTDEQRQAEMESNKPRIWW